MQAELLRECDANFGFSLAIYRDVPDKLRVFDLIGPDLIGLDRIGLR